MPKGKQFSAAEKHFEKKRLLYEKQIKHLNSCVSDQKAIISNQEAKIQSLSTENTQLHEWIERLLEYTELSKEDIKEACEKDKKLGSLLGIMDIAMRFM